MRSECCLAKASTSGVTVRVCKVVKRMRSLPASDSTIVLPQVPNPTTAALIMLTPDRLRVFYLGQVSMASAIQANIQNTQYSMPPITQIHFLVTL